ncbi:hypothetical protein [Azotobacter beijerinckii]|uniref:hypothetical protein n=1 Tax=Azotobacter beijerinckii TaxID=170623 RepID=UPI001587FBA1|nr:hypothetical protein [Azotobacter beijerinckii]
MATEKQPGHSGKQEGSRPQQGQRAGSEGAKQSGQQDRNRSQGQQDRNPSK